MNCPDTPWDHYQCGLASSVNSYRFAEAEKHFCRAIELSESGDQNSTLADSLIAYARLLVKLKRPHEAVGMYERRVAMKRFPTEDRLERRCTVEFLAILKDELAASSQVE